jgi:5-methylcytosine-specific restriction enzyme A
MPDAPLRPCRWPGCAALVERGYCALHRPPVALERPRLSSAMRGYGARWQRASKAFLQAGPLCLGCRAKGVITAATVVDHMRPHRGDPSLFWNQDNWQPLCKKCHDRKTVVEDGGFGRVRKAA